MPLHDLSPAEIATTLAGGIELAMASKFVEGAKLIVVDTMSSVVWSGDGVDVLLRLSLSCAFWNRFPRQTTLQVLLLNTELRWDLIVVQYLVIIYKLKNK